MSRGDAALVKELTHSAQCADQALDVVVVVIKIKARPDGRRDSKHFVQRLSAMMPGAARTAFTITDRRYVLWMYVGHAKADNSIGAISGLYAFDSVDFLEPIPSRSRQRFLMIGG